ncbi:glycosyltransferase [Kluyvera ascorbata]|uniref:glycosyltransferase n=1 Tax=Kluyvera ascorbata TaxID=51288 RepID=UPI002ABAF3EC|nr:glycosyltransferase [Kluyvera ascorbata]MDZ4030842.1 glycosyltransferase [Kluyvera ascorbata]
MVNQSVAVILSVYRSECPDYLYKSLQSMFSQTMPGDVYLYVDGNIPDPLERVIEQFKSESNFFIYRSDTNRGLAFALNLLINEVLKRPYKYIARMDTDDISHSTRLEKQFHFMEEHLSVDVLGGYCREFGSEFALELKRLPLEHEELRSFSIIRCPFIHPTVMFRSSVFNSGVRYPTNTVFTEDMALWFDLLERGFCFHNIPEVLLDYRLNENTFNRRRGIGKAISEVSVRFKYMIRLNEFSLKNIFLLFIKFCFHLLPSSLIQYAYKKCR